MSNLTHLEREILQHIVAHSSKNEEISLAELSAECHVSKSAIVKALQKLGYHGMRELKGSLRVNAQSSADVLLPRKVTEEGLEQSAQRLACCLSRHRDDRNFIFAGDKRCGDLLASYMSRKLAMFEILAPASYDYAIDISRKAPLWCCHILLS